MDSGGFTDFLLEPFRAFVSRPSFPLLVAGVLIFIVVGGIMYAIYRMRVRASRHVAELANSFESHTQELREAEKLGKYGSFLWDFENATLSFWSDEMFVLHGMIKRAKPPTIETIVGMVREEDRPAAKEAWEKAQKQPGDFTIVYRLVEPSGKERHVRVQGKTILIDDRPRRIKGVVHDITKEMEVDQAKTEFVSLASHQLKTPLTSIKWFVEALAGGAIGELSPQQKDYVLKIQEENQRMMAMINDLLNVSRMELGTLVIIPEEVAVGDIAKSAIDEQMQTANAKQVTVKLTVDPTVPVMYADKNLFRMVFQNLISNAIKYTPNGGFVECEISKGAIRGDTVAIRVTDTGIGIPKDDQDRVFQKLHRAKNAQALVEDGTGLGLYMVKEIIDHAGGNITFESVEGKGTTFLATIPLIWKGSEGTKPLAGATSS